MKILRDHPIPLFITVLALILAGVLLNHAWEQDVDITLTATEYRLDDPDYAVEHTVTLRGRGARNFFGKGRFEGTVSISGLTGLEDEQAIVLSFPKAEGRVFLVEGLVSLVDESGEVMRAESCWGPCFPVGTTPNSSGSWPTAPTVRVTAADTSSAAPPAGRPPSPWRQS